MSATSLDAAMVLDSVEQEETARASVLSAFQSVGEFLSQDHEMRERIREAVKGVEQASRELSTLMQLAHRGTANDGGRLCRQAREKLPAIQEKLRCLQQAFPVELYHRFHDHWKFCMQQLTFLCAFIVFLESGKLVTQEQLAEMLGVNIDKGFCVELEDMLQGFLTLATELARLAVNAVTYKDYRLPFTIANFINELNSGFRLLNLKNDHLRKHYDGLKYDVRKVEGVVYDLSIRGLKPTSPTQ